MSKGFEQRNNLVIPYLCFTEHILGWEGSSVIEHLSGILKILGFKSSIEKVFLIIE